MQWIDAGPESSLAEGHSVSIPVGRRMIAVVHSDGKFYAIEDVCTHDGEALTGGEVGWMMSTDPRISPR